MESNALPAADFPRPGHKTWQLGLAAALFLLALFTTTTLGAIWSVATHTEDSTDLGMWMGFETIRTVWSDPGMLVAGISFSIPLLVILLCHELGHYLPCRRYRLPSTPPYFLPVPFALGTLGAFIKIRSPIRNRRELLIVGAGGPLAGFVVLAPFLLIGIALSEPAPYEPAPAEAARALLFLPGQSLASQITTWAFHGPLPENTVLNLHPFALAAWVGLLATSLNLLPLAQLDGGHILYALAGRLQHKLALPLWIALAACSYFWLGWLLWCLIILIIGLRHPPVADEALGLEPRHRAVGWLCLLIFALSFMPIPLDVVPVS
ncbi:MAG: site-2 protease family protein [bacterium]|nr:site-2 protease family protein [bacterium]